MSGRIMIVDPVSTNRIVLKVKLLAARYEVIPCASCSEALERLEAEAPDIILIEASQLASGLAGFCESLRQSRLGARTPVLGLGQFQGSADRLVALAAGVDDILAKPFADSLLLARIRSLLRARNEGEDPDLPVDTRRALGFAEEAAAFEPSGTVAVIGLGELGGVRIAQSLSRLRSGQAAIVDPVTALGLRNGAAPDLFVIDAWHCRDRASRDEVYQLIVDLRSRSESCHAALLIVLPQGADDMAAMALDLGASATVSGDADPEEISHRARALLAGKARFDRIRTTLRSGLEAAMTDPLTGLYNRRYAMSHLSGLAERAAETGRSLAVMVLDIDHFKQINDAHGHAAGDQVLIGVANILRKNLRAVDLIARIGGEEFLIAIPDACAEAARLAAERLRQRIEAALFNPGGAASVMITLSVGIAVAAPNRLASGMKAIEELILNADAALYRSKTAGRNTVTLAQTAA